MLVALLLASLQPLRKPSRAASSSSSLWTSSLRRSRVALPILADMMPTATPTITPTVTPSLSMWLLLLVGGLIKAPEKQTKTPKGHSFRSLLEFLNTPLEVDNPSDSNKVEDYLSHVDYLVDCGHDVLS